VNDRTPAVQHHLPASASHLMVSKVGWTFLLGLGLRLLLMPLALHIDPRFTGDIVGLNQYAHLLVYDASSSLRAAPLYPPLAYYTIALFQILLHPLVGAPIPLEIFGRESAIDLLGGSGIFRLLFSFKIWYLLFDFGSAYLLYRVFRHDRRKAHLALAFWLLNPILIYGAYVHGQFDVVPVFFTVLSLYLASRERPAWAVFFLGVAACYKNYAFFFLPLAILILSQSWRKRLLLLFVGTVPYFLFLFPRLTEYTHSVSGYGDWFFKVGYDVGFGGLVYIFFALYAALLWYLSHRNARTYEGLWRACFAILLVYYQLSYFDLHYWAWIVPFAAIYFAEHPREATPFYLVILACLLVLTAPTPVARFLAPISPRFFLRLPSLMEVLNPYLPTLFLLNVVRSLLAGTCFYLAWRLLRDMPAARGPAAEAVLSQEAA
jgi:hypothetical protein